MKPQRFYRACYQFAAEHVGLHQRVELAGLRFSEVVCTPVYDTPGDSETLAHYQITLWGVCGAEAHHLEFERCGNLVFESIHEEGV
jgi:hypothetical protein